MSESNKTRAERSRAFLSTLTHCRDKDLRFIKLWIKQECDEWILITNMEDGFMNAVVYTRFKNQKSISIIQQLHPELNVSATKEKFKTVKERYNTGSITSSHVNSPDEKQWKQWQLNVLSTINFKAELKIIYWINFSKSSIDHARLLKHLSRKENVLMLEEQRTSICNMIESEVIKNNKSFGAAIICISPKEKIKSRFYELLKQIRYGFIPSHSLTFKPMNVIIFSNAIPSSEIRDMYGIELESIE